MPSFAFDMTLHSGVLCMFFTVARAYATRFGAACFFAYTLHASGMLAHHDESDFMVVCTLLCLYKVLPTAGRIIFFLAFLPGASAVCKTCWGSGIGCRVDSEADAICPWKEHIAQNTRAVTAAVGGVIVLGSLLTPRLLRVFTKPVLDTLAMVVARPSGNQPFDLTDKDLPQICKAVSARYVSKAEAILEFQTRLLSPELVITADDEGGALEAKKAKREDIKTAIQAIGALPERISLQTSTEGAFLFIMARLSAVLCTTKIISFDLCGEVEVSEEAHGSTSSRRTAHAATLTRPTTRAQCESMLHNWGYVTTVVGLAHVVSVAQFLDDVYYENVRLGKYEWFVGFEMVVLYLRYMERRPGKYSLHSVLFDSGGFDDFKEQALLSAKEHYPSAFFRGGRGEPRDVNDDDDKKKRDADGDEIFKGKLKGHSPNASKPCAAWNTYGERAEHKKKHVTADGRCKFCDKCNHWVTDKGAYGRCMGNHRAPDCDNPNKCDQPVRA